MKCIVVVSTLAGRFHTGDDQSRIINHGICCIAENMIQSRHKRTIFANEFLLAVIFKTNTAGGRGCQSSLKYSHYHYCKRFNR